jgi:hypothetical protein
MFYGEPVIIDSPIPPTFWPCLTGIEAKLSLSQERWQRQHEYWPT